MNIVPYIPNNVDEKHTISVLSQLDLVDFEIEHHCDHYMQLMIKARRRRALYKAAMEQRKEIAGAVSAALAEAEELLK